MSAPQLILRAISSTASASSIAQILLFLPLTLSTLSKPAFLLLSFLSSLQSFIHCTLLLVLPKPPPDPVDSSPRINVFHGLLNVFQVPWHSFLLLLAFNLFSPSPPSSALVSLSTLNTLADYWGKALRWSSPFFVGIEGLASLLVIQSVGMMGKELAGRSEGWQAALLVAAAVGYLGAASWIVISYPLAASTPLSSTLLGAAVTALIFLTLIGFALRRSNVIESAGMALLLAYNVWLCSDYDSENSYASWPEIPDLASTYAPLLPHLIPHLQTLLNFITHTLPKPLLASLLYRLSILHLASRIIPQIGGDAWENEVGVAGGDWEEERPTSRLMSIILTYRQTILITVYSHLLLLDQSSQIWWRWANVFFTLLVWAVEILVSAELDDEGLVKEWKID